MKFRDGWTVVAPAKGTFPAVLAGFFVLVSISACAGPQHLAAQPQTLAGMGPAEQAYAAYQKGDFHLAKAIWQDEADKGNSHAQYNLGVIYAEGRGTQQSTEVAVKWWEEAAKQGHAQAQHNLALSYIGAEVDEPGKVAEPNPSSARQWLEKAAEQGLAHSQYYLARLIQGSRSDAADMSRVVDLYQKAAHQGHGRAQDEIAAHCYRGEGIEQDFSESYYWSALAAAQGIDKAAFRMSLLESKLTRKELAKIKNRLSEAGL